MPRRKPRHFQLFTFTTLTLLILAALAYFGISRGTGPLAPLFTTPSINYEIIEEAGPGATSAEIRAVDRLNRAVSSANRRGDDFTTDPAVIKADQELAEARGTKPALTNPDDEGQPDAGTGTITTYTGSGGDSCQGGSAGVQIPDGKWAATGGTYSNDNDRACVQCRNGVWASKSPAACHAKYQEDPSTVVLPPSPGTEYTQGTEQKPSLGNIAFDESVLDNCYQGSSIMPTGNSAGDRTCFDGVWYDPGTYQDKMSAHCSTLGLVFAGARCEQPAAATPETPAADTLAPLVTPGLNALPGAYVNSPTDCESGLAAPVVPKQDARGSHRKWQCLPPATTITPSTSALTSQGATLCSGSNLLNYTLVGGIGRWKTLDTCDYGCNSSAQACNPKPATNSAKPGSTVTNKSLCPYGFKSVGSAYLCSHASYGASVASQSDCETGYATKITNPTDPDRPYRCGTKPTSESGTLLPEPTCTPEKQSECSGRELLCSPTFTGGFCSSAFIVPPNTTLDPTSSTIPPTYAQWEGGPWASKTIKSGPCDNVCLAYKNNGECKRWGLDESYNVDFEITGCGPTAVTNIANRHGGGNYTPDQIFDQYYDASDWSCTGTGAAPNIEALQQLGFELVDTTSTNPSLNNLANVPEYIDQDQVIFMGSNKGAEFGHWTTSDNWREEDGLVKFDLHDSWFRDRDYECTVNGTQSYSCNGTNGSQITLSTKGEAIYIFDPPN